MPLEESVVADVVNANFKTVAGMPGSLANIMLQDAISHARIVNGYREAAFATYLKSMAEVDPAEAVSMAKTLSADLPTVLAQLGTALGSIQQFVKAAQTTPPETGAK